jgi:hypothetical protein
MQNDLLFVRNLCTRINRSRKEMLQLFGAGCERHSGVAKTLRAPTLVSGADSADSRLHNPDHGVGSGKPTDNPEAYEEQEFMVLRDNNEETGSRLYSMVQLK